MRPEAVAGGPGTAGRRIGALAAAALALCGASAGAQPLEHQVDPLHSAVHVELRVGPASVLGRFERPTGSLQINRETRRAALELRVDAGTWNSGVATLDAAVRGAGLLDVERAPEIVFRAAGIALDGDRVATVDGTLELRGARHALRFTVRRSGCYLNPLLQRQVCGGDFEASVPRAALGLAGGPAELGPTLRILVQLEAIRQ